MSCQPRWVAAPFRGMLRPDSRFPSEHNRLRTSDANSDLVIRIVEGPYWTFENLHTARAVLLELATSYGVTIPDSSWLISGAKDERAAYVVTRVVRGEPLRDVAESAMARKHLLHACQCLSRYYFNKWRDGGLYQADLHADQFVFGSVGEESPRLYMVDVDPGFVELTPATKDPWALARLHRRLADVVNMAGLVLRGDVSSHQELVPELDEVLRSELLDGAQDRRAELRHALQVGDEVDGSRWL